MRALWHLRGSLALDGRVPPAAVLDQLEAVLEGHGLEISLRQGWTLEYENPIKLDLLRLEMGALAASDGGRIAIDGAAGTLSMATTSASSGASS